MVLVTQPRSQRREHLLTLVQGHKSKNTQSHRCQLQYTSSQKGFLCDWWWQDKEDPAYNSQRLLVCRGDAGEFRSLRTSFRR